MSKCLTSRLQGDRRRRPVRCDATREGQRANNEQWERECVCVCEMGMDRENANEGDPILYPHFRETFPPVLICALLV